MHYAIEKSINLMSFTVVVTAALVFAVQSLVYLVIFLVISFQRKIYRNCFLPMTSRVNRIFIPSLIFV